MDDIIKKVFENFKAYQKSTIPLCEAENVISDFCKLPLSGDLQERYIMGNYNNHNYDDNFIGSEMLLPFYNLIQKECKKLFESEYSDARTLSGMNCLTTLLMALTIYGDKIMILSPQWGGHMSVPFICDRLGLIQYHAPYNKEQYDLDFDKLNEILEKENIKFILLPPSDIINPPSVSRIKLQDRILLYDASQLLGLIAGKQIENPLRYSDRIIMFGGTHKTLPGPASGIILTNNAEFYASIEKEINPKYLRHTQMHQVASLLFTLMEMSYFGEEYMKSIVDLSNTLAAELEKYQFKIGKINGRYSFTHQIFIETTKTDMQTIFRNGILHRVTLNDKQKALFNGFGIRLGTQEIARYKWGADEAKLIAIVLNELRKPQSNSKLIKEIRNSLPEKNIYYTFPRDVYDEFKEYIMKP